jgi:hypothetical protein
MSTLHVETCATRLNVASQGAPQLPSGRFILETTLRRDANEGHREATKRYPTPTEIFTLSMGQSIDQVTAALGTPKNIVDLGAKKIYVYKDMKVTFKAGKVADVQ